ncbi:galactosyl transferase [Klebsiella pneumoniae]|nr:galactosyl transferase [Klebsiella pneumoniae]
MNMMISYQELVRTFLSNPKARVEMGIKGRKRIQDKFSSGMIISKTLKTYHDVVEG